MKNKANKTQNNKKNQSVNEVSRSQNSNQVTFQFVDNRPETIRQQKMQTIADSRYSTPIQKQELEEEELLQGKFKTIQRQELEEEELLQGKFEPVQKKKNNTGLPDNLKSGMENLSGMRLDHVKTHYNSSKPAAVQAHAYAQGNNIHLASGQEKHLPHELAHVVQQAQGRVKPTTTVNGMAVNDNVGLETEADGMGAKALRM
jgi:hypothetical protein